MSGGQLCGGQLCRCGQDSGRGKPLPYGKTGVFARQRHATPFLCSSAVGGSALFHRMAVKVDAKAPQRDTTLFRCKTYQCYAAPKLHSAFPRRGHSLHFLWVTIQCRCGAMLLRDAARLRSAGAVLIGAVPWRSKTALLLGISVLIPSEAFLHHTYAEA